MEKPCDICDNCKYGAAICQNGARFEIDLAPGYRFKPTDSELLIHYLKNKVKGKPLPSNIIRQFNIYSEDPEQLKATFKPDTDENAAEMYFFTPRDRKYKDGVRPNRAAKNGYWKAWGKEKTVIHNGKEIGKKQALAFHQVKPDAKKHGKKTDWLMHEFRLDGTQLPKGSGDNGMKLDNFVLCKIYKKDKKTKVNAEDKTCEANQEENIEEHDADVTNIHTTGFNNDVMNMGNNNFQIQSVATDGQDFGAQNQHDQLSTQPSFDLVDIEKYFVLNDQPGIYNGAIFAELPNFDDFLDII